LSLFRSRCRLSNNSNGYYDTFIPAMKRLSKSYAEYVNQLNVANEKLREKISPMDFTEAARGANELICSRYIRRSRYLTAKHSQ